MRTTYTRPPLLLLVVTILLAALQPCLAQIDTSVLEKPAEAVVQSDAINKLKTSLSPNNVKDALKAAPERLKLGAENFLGTGVRRKSVANAYSTSIGVVAGAGAITNSTNVGIHVSPLSRINERSHCRGNNDPLDVSAGES